MEKLTRIEIEDVMRDCFRGTTSMLHAGYLHVRAGLALHQLLVESGSGYLGEAPRIEFTEEEQARRDGRFHERPMCPDCRFHMKAGIVLQEKTYFMDLKPGETLPEGFREWLRLCDQSIEIVPRWICPDCGRTEPIGKKPATDGHG